MLYSLCFVLIAIGLYTVFVKKNLIKIVLGFMIIEYGINLLLVLIGYRAKGQAPILGHGESIAGFVSRTVDPVPQIMVIASIAIGLGMLLFMVALCVRLYQRYGTFDITEMRRLKG